MRWTISRIFLKVLCCKPLILLYVPLRKVISKKSYMFMLIGRVKTKKVASNESFSLVIMNKL